MPESVQARTFVRYFFLYSFLFLFLLAGSKRVHTREDKTTNFVGFYQVQIKLLVCSHQQTIQRHLNAKLFPGLFTLTRCRLPLTELADQSLIAQEQHPLYLPLLPNNSCVQEPLVEHSMAFHTTNTTDGMLACISNITIQLCHHGIVTYCVK